MYGVWSFAGEGDGAFGGFGETYKEAVPSGQGEVVEYTLNYYDAGHNIICIVHGSECLGVLRNKEEKHRTVKGRD